MHSCGEYDGQSAVLLAAKIGPAFGSVFGKITKNIRLWFCDFSIGLPRSFFYDWPMVKKREKFAVGSKLHLKSFLHKNLAFYIVLCYNI